MRTKELVQNIFSELEGDENNSIEKGRQLEFKDGKRIFECSIFPPKKIFCNSNFTLPDDSNILRFFLLHEEGHFHRIQYKFLFWIGFAICSLFSLVLLFIWVDDWGIIQKLIPYFLGWIVFWVIFFRLIYELCYPLFADDELRSDKYAAEILNIKFPNQIPSELIGKSLDFYEIAQKEINKPSIKIIKQFDEFINKYYPSTDERKKHIRQTVDKKI